MKKIEINSFAQLNKEEQEQVLKAIINSKFSSNKGDFTPSELWEYVFEYKIFDNYPELKYKAEEKLITSGDILLIEAYRDKKAEIMSEYEVCEFILKCAKQDANTAYILLTDNIGIGKYIMSRIDYHNGAFVAKNILEEALINSNNESLKKKYVNKYLKHILKAYGIESSKILGPDAKYQIIKNHVLVRQVNMGRNVKAITIFSENNPVIESDRNNTILLNKRYVDSLHPNTERANKFNDFICDEIMNAAMEYQNNSYYYHRVSLNPEQNKKRVLKKIK